MALFDDLLKGNVATGLAIGIGAAIVGPIVLPIIAGAAKPLAKAVIKSGLMLYERGKETSAEMAEVFEDIVAEARAEIAEEHTIVAPAAQTEVEPQG